MKKDMTQWFQAGATKLWILVAIGSLIMGRSVTAAPELPQTFLVERLDVISLMPGDFEMEKEQLLLMPGEQVTPGLLQEVEKQIRKACEAQGLEGAQVRLAMRRINGERLRLIYFILGTTIPTLEDLELKGSGLWDIFNRERLRKGLKKDEKRGFQEGEPLEPGKLIQLESRCALFYHNRGYLDAKVWVEEIEVEEDGEATIICRIEKGEKYELAEFKIVTDKPVPEDQKKDLETFYQGKDYDYLVRENLRKDVEKLAQLQGYMAPEIETREGIDPEGHKVAVFAQVKVGNTSTLGDIQITRRPPEKKQKEKEEEKPRRRKKKSTSLVQMDVVERQPVVKPGDPLDYFALEGTRMRLERLNVFDEIQVETRPTSNSQVRDMVIDVRQGKTGRFSLFGGYGTERGAAGGIQVMESNVGGRADQIILGMQATGDSLSASFTYFDRYWGWAEKWLGKEREPSLAHRLYIENARYDEYKERVSGLQWTFKYLRKNPQTFWRDAWELRLEDVELSPRLDEDHYAEDFDDYVVFAPKYRIYHDSRNRGDFSTEGAYLAGSLETGHAGGFLVKTLFQGQYYQPIWKKLGWATKGQLGLIPMDIDDIPIRERFHAGGIYDFRGFEARGVGPVDPKESRLHRGGATKAILQNELRFHMTDNILPLLFVDAGNVGEDAFELEDINMTAGAGLRYMIPGMGQVFLSFGQQLLDQKTDETSSFQMGLRFGF